MMAIFLTALITFLVLLVEHWFPWMMLLRRELSRFAAYVLGVLGLMVPFTGLLAWWEIYEPGAWVRVVGLWVVLASGGLAVGIGYLVDWILGRIALAKDLKELEDKRR